MIFGLILLTAILFGCYLGWGEEHPASPSEQQLREREQRWRQQSIERQTAETLDRLQYTQVVARAEMMAAAAQTRRQRP